jgi:hypothetical protein
MRHQYWNYHMNSTMTINRMTTLEFHMLRAEDRLVLRFERERVDTRSVFLLLQAILLLLVNAVMFISAQRCLSHPCGKLSCADVSCTFGSQADCSDAEEYLYPGLLCECCGACVTTSVGKFLRFFAESRLNRNVRKIFPTHNAYVCFTAHC